MHARFFLISCLALQFVALRSHAAALGRWRVYRLALHGASRLSHEIAKHVKSADQVFELSYLENFVDSRHFMHANSGHLKDNISKWVSTHLQFSQSYKTTVCQCI
jgi:hypothetical protein